MAYADDVALWQQRFLANMPQASLTGTGAFNNFGQSIIGGISDAKDAVDKNAPAMTLQGSTGQNLANKALDYAQLKNVGLASLVALNFSVQVAPTNPGGLLIPVGTIVQTIGDNVAIPSVAFQTTAAATILQGTTSITNVPATCITTFANNQASLGNVAANTITQVVGSLAGNPQVTNPLAAFGGVDGDSDATLRAKAYAFLAGKYSTAQMVSTALAVTPVFDAYVYDPQNGAGSVTLYWSDVAGNSNTNGVVPTCYHSDGTGTLNIEEAKILPPNLRVTYQGFTIVAVTLSATYSIPPTVQQTYIEPLIQQYMAQFVNQLTHGMAVVPYQMQQYVTSMIGSSLLTNFVPTVTPSSAATPVIPPTLASTTTLYRFQGSTSSIVLTKV